jgi:predicted phosphodiesterase
MGARGLPPFAGEPWRKFVEQGEWWAGKLSAGDRAFMRTFVPRIELQLEGVHVLCFHGSPGSYDDMILATTPHEKLLDLFAGFDQPLMLGGHTHVQLVRVVEGRLVVNPGSIGLAFRGLPLGELQLISPWAEYALIRIESERLSVDLRRARYDVEGMLRRTIDSGAPHAEWWAQTWVLAGAGPPQG